MKAKKTNFFSVLAGVCSDPEIFASLLRFPWTKALGHLFILSVGCALFFSFAISFKVTAQVKELCAFLQANFGGLVINDAGITPKLDPFKPRAIKYHSFLIDYRPAGIDAKSELNLLNPTDRLGFIWTPTGVIGWNRANGSNFIVYQAVVSKQSERWFDVVRERGISDYLNKHKFPIGDKLLFRLLDPGDPFFVFPCLLYKIRPLDNFNATADYAVSYFLFRSLVTFCAKILLYALFYSLLFSFIFNVTAPPPYRVSYASYFTMTLYAAFPGVIIGTLFAAGQQPWLDYQTIFLVVFVVYLMVVSRKIKSLTGGDETSDETD